ncbi:MAG: helix-turn-helix domain-containing protein, partial [Vulcanimicrobiaceae bacterium]
MRATPLQAPTIFRRVRCLPFLGARIHSAMGVARGRSTITAMTRIETIRLYPTASQKAALEHVLHVTRHLYNALLQQ